MTLKTGDSVRWTDLTGEKCEGVISLAIKDERGTNWIKVPHFSRRGRVLVTIMPEYLATPIPKWQPESDG